MIKYYKSLNDSYVTSVNDNDLLQYYQNRKDIISISKKEYNQLRKDNALSHLKSIINKDTIIYHNWEANRRYNFYIVHDNKITRISHLLSEAFDYTQNLKDCSIRLYDVYQAVSNLSEALFDDYKTLNYRAL